MHIYIIKRSWEIDKNGRPVIYLAHFGDQSLIWCGTTIKNKKAPDKPLIIKNLSNEDTYFYNYNIEKVLTNDLKVKWKDKVTNIPYILNVDEQKILISKWLNLTNQKNPFQRINLLKLENERLELENKLLKQQNQKAIDNSKLESTNENQQ